MKASAVSMWTVLKAQLCASPRKAAVLGVLTLVLLVLTVRMLLRGPKVAEGQTMPVATEINGLAVQPAPDAALVTGPAFLPRPRLPSQPARDPFSVDRHLFEPIPGNEAVPQETVPIASPDPLLQVLSRLSLQSTVTGDHPLATVNGLVLRIGDSIEGFTVKSIGSRTIEVAYGDRVFELSMK